MTNTRTERVILTSAAQTTDQTSETFVIPRASRRFLLVVAVTTGAALALQITLQVRVDSLSAWVPLVVGVPRTPITSVGVTPTCFGDSSFDSDIDCADVAVGGRLRAVVVHGNATAATYTVTLKPL